MRILLKYKAANISIFGYCYFFINTLAISLPNDYQEKLLVPEPLLQTGSNDISKSLSETEKIIESLYAGDSIFRAGNLALACSKYKEGLDLVDETGGFWQKILFRNRIGFASYWLSNFQEAGEHYLHSIELMEEAVEIQDTLLLLEALVFFRTCHEIKPYINGDEYISKYADYLEWKPVSTNSIRLAKYHLLNAIWYAEDQNFREQKQALKKAEEQLYYVDDHFWLFLIRYYQAAYYLDIKDINLMGEFLTELIQQVNSDSNFFAFRYFIYTLQCYQLTADGDNTKARYFADKIIPFIEKKIHPAFYYDHILHGWVYQHSGYPEKAMNSFIRAKELLDINTIEDSRLALVYWYIANYQRTVKLNADSSLHYFTLAKNVLDDDPDFILESYVYWDIGNYYYRNKEFEKAIEFFNTLLDDLDLLLSDEVYFSKRYPYLVNSKYSYLLKRRAKAFFYHSKSKNYDLTALNSSYRDFKDLLLLQKKIYDETFYEASKITVLDELRSVSNSLLNVGFTLFEESGDASLPEELFGIVEGSKAYLFNKYTSDDMAKRMAGIPEELIENAKKLHKELDTLQYSLASTDINLGKPRENLLINNILRKQGEYRAYIGKLELEYPEYAELKENSGNISKEEIQGRLLNSQVFIDYHYNQNSLYLFYIDKDTLQIVYRPVDMSLPERILNFRKSLEEIQYGDFDPWKINEFARQSHELYKIVLQPVEKLIGGKRLLIVPDRELNLIPFEALVISKPDTAYSGINLKELNYLVHQNAISYLYSASQLLNINNPRRGKVRFAGFAPDYSKLRLKTNESNNLYSQLGELPGAVDEVVSACSYFNGKLYTGKDLSKSMFFKANVKNDIIHLAMHTILDNEEPMNSELIISSNPDNMLPQLRAYEVYSKKNSASLVVLSACNTGMGKLKSGEGIFSMARAFLLAGVNNVVLTQWAVADRSSATLMDKYYYYLSQGYPTDIALQQSKIDFLRFGDPVKAHPYYWAGYLNVGYPFNFSGRTSWFVWLLIIVLPGILILSYYRYRSKLF